MAFDSRPDTIELPQQLADAVRAFITSTADQPR
jgi:hypothetical protein